MAAKSKPVAKSSKKKETPTPLKLTGKRRSNSVAASPASPKAKISTSNSKKLSLTMWEIIEEAFGSLDSGRGGSSLQAIKKYVNENHEMDLEKNNKLFLKTLRKAVAEGTVIQLKGVGANGSFRLAKVPIKTTSRTGGKMLEENILQSKGKKKAATKTGKTAKKTARK